VPFGLFWVGWLLIGLQVAGLRYSSEFWESATIYGPMPSPWIDWVLLAPPALAMIFLTFGFFVSKKVAVWSGVGLFFQLPLFLLWVAIMGCSLDPEGCNF